MSLVPRQDGTANLHNARCEWVISEDVRTNINGMSSKLVIPAQRTYPIGQ